MQKTEQKTFADTFKQDVFNGLSAFPKYLFSKYIYDQKGDKLFQRIMEMPEYYLTDCEFDILQTHTKAIGNLFANKGAFDLVELGAGDGKKTKILLRDFAQKKLDFQYLPIDISQHALDDLKQALAQEIPQLAVAPQQGMYFEVLERLAKYNKRRKVILMLGSNIGNLLHPKAVSFLKQVREAMSKDDLLFVGFDQKKHPQTILNAYNDPTGITEAFNKNLLHRINRELDANFDVDSFMHWETYDPESGTAKSYLVSTKEQKARVGALGIEVTFKEWETIHTEISQKYDDDVVEWLAQQAGLTTLTAFTDDKGYYKDYVFVKKE